MLPEYDELVEEIKRKRDELGWSQKKLAQKATKNGTDIWISSPVKKLLKNNDQVKGVITEAGEWSEEIETKIVIDATGSRAQWASLYLKNILNREWDKERNQQTNEYLMTNVPENNKIDLYFNSILAPLGHAWIYPSEKNYAMAGIRGVRIHPDSALDEFIGREEPERLQNSTPIGAYRGQSPVEGALESTVSDGIIAVGSSAGQIYPLSAHGIRYAFKAGRIAGRVAAQAIEENDYSEEKLKKYDRLWREEFGDEIKVGEILRDAFSTSPDRKMNSLLEAMENNPELQKNFVNIFLGNELETSLRDFFKHKECKNIIGEGRADRILALYP